VNGLEQSVRDELTRVPAGPAATELRRRAATRRARRVGGGVVAIVLVLIGFGIGVLLHSPAQSQLQVVQTGPAATRTTLPDATTAVVPPLAKIREVVGNLVMTDVVPNRRGSRAYTAQIAVTTVGHTSPPFANGGAGAGQRRYVVQVIGNVECNSCFGLTKEPGGRAFSDLFDSDGEIVGTTLGPRIYDLSRLGPVYRLRVATPPSTSAPNPHQK
jgi:hypothetical protein